MTAPERTPPPRVHEPLLRVHDLSVRHEGADAATPRDVTFDVRPGEVVLVLGPSGSGKSTLTLSLNGLIPQSVPATVTGTVEVGGLSTIAAPVAELSTRVAMVFQDPDAQLVTGTVFDEVAFGLENLLVPVDEVLARTEQALRHVGLWDRRNDNPDTLSGGGRQRLAIACAIAMGSPLLVLDEPTANLDPAGIDDVYAALAELVRDGDRAVVLVEHNLDAAMHFVDRVIVLDQDGALAHDGPADTVLREHAAELARKGVWLPTATLAALRLREAGIELDPLPLTPEALRAALAAPGGKAEAHRVRRTARSSQHPLDSVRDSRNSANFMKRMPGAEAAAPGENPLIQTPLIQVRGLDVVRGRTTVLRGVDLDVAEGDFVAIIGANGTGKTSLIQAIAGVVPPPRGHVRVADIDPGKASPRELTSRIGFVFQNPEHQFVAHTVFDELAHGLRLRRVPEAEVTARVHDMLERFGLTDKADAHPFLLSGGQKRRLSVGTALITGAPTLALDEPTFGQDRARAEELLTLLRDLNREGTTVLVVTHDMQLVAEYASHVVMLGDGGVQASGPTAEVFSDEAAVTASGLRLPPLAHALRGIPGFDGVVRLRDLTAAVTA